MCRKREFAGDISTYRVKKKLSDDTHCIGLKFKRGVSNWDVSQKV
jgi:hypothetical protein